MAVEFFKFSDYEHRQEAEARDVLIEQLRAQFASVDELVLCAFAIPRPCPMDFLVVKKNAIIIGDFKHCGGPILANKADLWKIQAASGETIMRGGTHWNPFRQLQSYKMRLRDELLKSQEKFLVTGNQPELSHIACHVVICPFLEEGSKVSFDYPDAKWFSVIGLDKAARRIEQERSPSIKLTDVEMKRLMANVLECVPYHSIAPAATFVTQDELPRPRASLARNMRILVNEESTADSQEKFVFETSEQDQFNGLDPSLEEFLDIRTGGHRLIRGVAGSGKTIGLLSYARAMSRAFPLKTILFTCYNRTLARELEARLSDCPNIEVANIHRLMPDLIYKAGAPRPQGSGSEFFETILPETFLKLLDSGKITKRYFAVIIDEAQDFGSLYFQVCKSLLEKSSEIIVLAADGAQKIFKPKVKTWKEAGINVSGGHRSKVLSKNYRNTREIARFAYSFLEAARTLRAVNEAREIEEWEEVIKPEAAVRPGSKPVVVNCSSVEQEMRSVVEHTQRIAMKGVPPRSIAILCPSNQSVSRVEEELKRIGMVGVLKVVGGSKSPGLPDGRDAMVNSVSPVIFGMIQALKGLEFPHVILLASVQEGVPESEKLLYVGMTRATEELVVIVNTTTAMSPIFSSMTK